MALPEAQPVTNDPVPLPGGGDAASDYGTVKSRAVSGIKTLGLRSVASILLRIISSLALARLLFPDDYGLFSVAAYITGLAAFFGDIGLGAGLIRQEETPTEDEMATVFWSQQAMTGLIITGLLTALPALMSLYQLSQDARLLLVAMTLGMFLQSLRIIPMLALERRLRFDVVARCELIENVVQTASTVGLAYAGLGVWALAGGGLIRGLVGLVIVWLASPWRPTGRFRYSIAVRLARFGIPFQLSALVPSLLAGWMPLVVTRLLGVGALGLINWANNIASVPMILAQTINRVAFPTYSRLHSDPEELGRVMLASLRRLSAALSVTIPPLVIVLPVVIPFVFGKRWAPAVPLVQWFSLEIFVLVLAGVLAQVQSASGRPGERLAVATVFGLIRWGVGYAAVVRFGLLGIGPSMVAVTLCEAVATALLIGQRIPGFSRLALDVFGPVVVTGVVLAVAFGAGYLSVPGQHHLLLRSVVTLLVFLILMAVREWRTAGHPLLTELRGLSGMLRPAAAASRAA